MAVVLTNFGETFVVDKMDEVLAIKGDMLALGTSTAAPAKGNINLGAEVTCMGQSPGGRIQGATRRTFHRSPRPCRTSTMSITSHSRG